MAPRGSRGRWLVTGSLVLAIGVGATVVRAGAPDGSEPPSNAWIDTPLGGTIVEPGPVTVLAHATDAGGVTGLRLLVDDEPSADANDLSGTLAQATFTVEIVAEGEHRLVAVGVGESGEVRSAPVVLVVGTPTDPTTTSTETTLETTTTTAGSTTVPGSTAATTVPRTAPPTVATTVAPTAPPTPPPTPPPTAPPTTTCTLVTPTVISPAGSETNNSTVITFVWRYDGPCDPATFVVQVSRDRTFSTVDVSARVDGNLRSVTLSVFCEVGTWQWRVGPSASPSGASPGPWSAPGVFNRTLCR
jgi:hypothetical protein